ncbi:hypothetical protein EYF80_065103 [Liparis tanakae]|uniref:Uncharacterized protein n=1 Tax=Liparis tanakae TaxID=230148 RepID=A0A4Z2E7N4_9TELE|nr:hypothetical protein EYF80_065103 [Liparis tanakae]
MAPPPDQHMPRKSNSRQQVLMPLLRVEQGAGVVPQVGQKSWVHYLRQSIQGGFFLRKRGSVGWGLDPPLQDLMLLQARDTDRVLQLGLCFR